MFFIIAGLLAIHSGHIQIGSRYHHTHTIIYMAQQPKEYWLYVVFVFAAGITFIFQGIKSEGSDA
jgi:hypothetical protein